MIDYLFDDAPRCSRSRYCSISLGGSKSNSRQDSGSSTWGPLGAGQDKGTVQTLLTKLIGGNAPAFGDVNAQPFQPITPTGLNSMGLYGGQQDAFAEAVRQSLGQLSGNFANRGFNTPRAVGAIAGSAAQNVLPQFAPLMGQQISTQDQLRHQLSLAPEEVRRSRNEQLVQFIQALSQALGPGSSSFGSGTASSFSVSGSAGQKP